MKLEELIVAVKEEGLTKDQLEKYHTEITYLDNLMRMEIAPLEKEEALFFAEQKPMQKISDKDVFDIDKDVFDTWVKTKEKTDIEIKRAWRATEKGQRQIELSHYLKVTPKLLQSIRTRLYAIY